MPADEVDEVRIVAGWVAEHEPPELGARPGAAGRGDVRAFAESAGGGRLAAFRCSSSCSRTARSAASKPIFECVPSQNGLVVEPPQRHSAIVSPRSDRSYSLPSASMSLTGPVTL